MPLKRHSIRQVSAVLEELRRRLQGRVVIVGVGNELRGDDGFGPAVIERLRGRVVADLLDCGEVPESYLGRITSLMPDSILVVDAVDLDAAPGAMALLEPDDLVDKLGFTHSPTLGLFLKFLENETGAKATILGVQPGSRALGEGLSAGVAASMDAVCALLSSALPRREDTIVQ